MTNKDSSATSNALPHSGQFGRLKFEVASAQDLDAWRADWTVIVDLLDALHCTQSSDSVRGLYGVATTRT